jgi:2-polyprenyl-3-methyl-5-hydroxy-6-metoxy-1,4-benzoquinol methylase
MSEGLAKGIEFLKRGQFDRVWSGVHIRIYRLAWELLYLLVKPMRRSGRPVPLGKLEVQTKYPVAFESPDHKIPHGTAKNNSTNKKFVLHMDEKLHGEFGTQTLRVMDLGCSGGQMVIDFLELRWVAIGIEGSDHSLKHKRANWKDYANKNLFTADITKPFSVKLEGKPSTFHLITAWEVMEHIAQRDLEFVFDNIRDHLEPGGYFIASTTSTPDVQNGIDLHQTQWENSRWREYVERSFPDLEYVDVGLRTYQFVRCNFDAPSFLLYRKLEQGTP